MKKNDLFDEVVKNIAEVAEIPIEDIKEDSNLLNDLELESLDIVSLVSILEKNYNIEILDKDIKTLITVGDVVRYIESHV